MKQYRQKLLAGKLRENDLIATVDAAERLLLDRVRLDDADIGVAMGAVVKVFGIDDPHSILPAPEVFGAQVREACLIQIGLTEDEPARPILELGEFAQAVACEILTRSPFESRERELALAICRAVAVRMVLDLMMSPYMNIRHEESRAYIFKKAAILDDNPDAIKDREDAHNKATDNFDLKDTDPGLQVGKEEAPAAATTGNIAPDTEVAGSIPPTENTPVTDAPPSLEKTKIEQEAAANNQKETEKLQTKTDPVKPTTNRGLRPGGKHR